MPDNGRRHHVSDIFSVFIHLHDDSDNASVCQDWPPAVAGIDRRIDLSRKQEGTAVGIVSMFDPRNHSLRHTQVISAHGETVYEDLLLHLWQS